MWVQYDEGSPELYLPDAQVTARRGVPVEVPDDVAGRPPSGAPGDLGEGLLAQVRRWRKVDPPDGTADPDGAEPAPARRRKVTGTASATLQLTPGGEA